MIISIKDQLKLSENRVRKSKTTISQLQGKVEKPSKKPPKTQSTITTS